MMKLRFPVGCIVRVELGRSICDIEVEGHGQANYDPTYLTGRNIDTGKQRRFSVLYTGCEVMRKAREN